MLFTITSTTGPATDLGWILHKNPGSVRSIDLSFGKAHVFYPEAGESRCTAALLLDVDPVGLVRRGDGEGLAESYVNDRPYAASSFLSVAIAQVYGTALAGRCTQRPELPDTPLALEATIAALPCRGGEALLRRLFEPLGWTVTAERELLDPAFPAWGGSAYHRVTLTGTHRVVDLLSHVYVLVPVLDDEKHYWVGESEVEKLLRHGEGWLASHPERELIALRYLAHRRGLQRSALERLAAADDSAPEPDDDGRDEKSAGEAAVEAPLRLNDVRMEAVLRELRGAGAKSVLDLGCGEGRLLRDLFDDPWFERIVGLEVSHRELDRAHKRLHLDRAAPRKAARITLLHGSVVYRDRRLEGFDAAAAVEVIEHLDPHRLGAFERTVFEFARPATVVVTTPNSEHNVRFANLAAGKFRHADHRFEWTRAEFRAWAESVASRRGYAVRFEPVGPDDPEVGPPTQMGVFTRG